MEKEVRAWRIYGAISTLAFVVLATSAFTVARQRATFGTIDVQRINVVEPDGTLRMVISDKTRFPGEIIKGKDFPRASGRIFWQLIPAARHAWRWQGLRTARPPSP